MKRKGILCFLKKDNQILLIKVDFGDKLVWNGISGFIDEKETNQEAAIREVNEELGIIVDKKSLTYKGNHIISDQLNLDIFIASQWQGNPKPQEESIKEIQWFEINNLPYHQMFEDNKDWLPKFLK